jgi:hypothetical protein
MVKSVYDKPSILTRIAVGKGLGLLIGLAGFVVLPMLWPDVDPLFRWGILLWYTTFGAVVGVFGVLSYNPVLMLPMPWWVRAPIIGGWMNFVLTFFAYDQMQAAIIAMLGVTMSPFWFTLEGAVVGAIIGGIATRLGGEGRRTAEIMLDDQG